MKLTFRWKLFLYFVVIILLTSIPIAVITHNYIYTFLKKDIVSETRRQMVQVDNTFSNMFKQIKDNNRFLASSVDVKKADASILALFNMPKDKSIKKYSKGISGIESTIYNQFETYGITHPDASDVYLGTKWGGYIRWPDGLIVNKYDPRIRPWYTDALKKPNEVLISAPYTSSDEHNSLIISASSTVKDSSGNVLGVMGIDVSLNKLSKMIENVKMGDTGYVFLFSKEGTILAHPDSNLNFKNITLLNKKNYKDAETGKYLKYTIKDYNKLFTENNSDFETIIDGKPVLVNVYSSPYTGWKMASVVPKSELTSTITKIEYFIFYITLTVLFLTLLFTLIFTKYITKPIMQLTSLMHEAEKGNLEVRATNIQTRDEFGELGIGFNVMINKISSTYEELLAVHEELSATEEELRQQYDELQYKEESLRISDERYQLALEGSNDSIWEFDLKAGFFFASAKLFEITGYKPTRSLIINDFLQKLVHPEDSSFALKDLENYISNKTSIYKSEFRMIINDGTYIWVSTRGKALRNSDGIAVKLAGSITDITERKNSEDKIKYMAYYDALTKLPNRTFFMNKLNQQLKIAKHKNTGGAVFFIDLDNFKNINDTMGHNYGDKLLTYIAKQLESTIKINDTLCRLGGDEFILLHPLHEEFEVKSYAKGLLAIFDKFFEIDNKQMYITASIGVAIYPKDGMDINTILKNADVAMYKAKELGKNRFARFDGEMYLKLERKTCIDRILRNAIENNELSIHYQPQYDAQRNEIFGFEALLRLNSVELGFVPPVEFIPIAEETGYISEIDRWVLNEACKQSVKWLQAGYKFKSISINVSSVDIHQINFLETVKGILKSTGINPSIVELEITETVLMESLDSNIKILKELMNMGIRIALDDFGTGYSSLNYLMRIPISTLKIDKSFIDNITSNKQNKSIIKNIIQMAHSMDLKVVAEGVETEEQLLILKGKQCDYIQGYYYSKPLNVVDTERLLDTNIV
ncbi:EAL domain-containing protein [Clostridium bowmanii]|uniref:bifunctional diguanylate cyclase/phosphodiesterase n=1 Tax=Clostridium bowmanii TaxID=132925 RepID=UPI001C0C4AE9|nr:EAL domain-containing protein [Clostridium bowmanii]MBU3190016.1 EAL domain-containing protein [Clostridium bowmanii]MCA1074547.1 EAL domain-containing protein [Clostridium bowmanii]